MKKAYAILAVAAVILMLTISMSEAKEKQIYIIHEDMPEWAIQTVNGTHYWFTDRYAYGVGIAPPMKNRHLQKTTAENRARNTLITGLRTHKVFSGMTEIRDTWKDPDTKKVYALARTPIKIIPAEK